METKICKNCGEVFTPDNKDIRHRYCSRKCAQTYLYQHPKGATCICKQCGEPFISKVNAVGMYCSRLCNDISRKKKSIEKQIIKQNFKYQYVCIICGKDSESRTKHKRICSDKCLKEQARRSSRLFSQKKHGVKTVVCKECGEKRDVEYGDKTRTFCSIECSHRHSGRVSKALRRARIKGLQYERINPVEIFVRDKWHCKLCGVSTPIKLRGSFKDNAPELDHIIPVSKDGTHTKDNVQCLCGSCNNNKSDRINLQLQFA